MLAARENSKIYILRFILAALSLAVATTVGLYLLPPNSTVILIWPPSAIAMALLFLYGIDLWPAIFLAIFSVLVLRNGNIPLDMGIAVANTLEAIIGTYFLKNHVDLHPLLFRLRDTLGLLVAAIASSLVSSVIIEVTLYSLGRVSFNTFPSTLSDIWIAHAVSTLSFTPFLIRWLYRPYFTKTRREIIEGIAIFGGIAILNYLVVWTPYAAIGSVSLIYFIFIWLIWAALRSGPRGTTLALALTTSIDITGVIFGHGSIQKAISTDAVFAIQVFLGLLDMIFLIFASLVEERKEAVKKLQDNISQLERAIEKIKYEDQVKTNFLAILAHELRNPLSPIVTSVELLKEDITEPGHQKTLETIESHSHTISLLLDDLLDISRITQNRLELRRGRISLQETVKRSLEAVDRLIKSRNHTLEVFLPAEEIYLDGDQVRVEQIFVNLLNNAAKYTDPGGKITLSAVAVGHYASITVRDTGIGIAPDKINRIFEAFGQQGAEVRQPGGLGVGLSLSKRLAEMHGGFIEAKSPGLGHGSSFTVRLPLSVGEAKPSIARNFVNRLRSTGTSAKKSILIVDDNIPAAETLSNLLSRRGHFTMQAHNGAEALETARKNKFDCIVLDIGLPDMDGYEVARKLRKDLKPLPKLIALTGYGQEEDKQKTFEAGFDAHLIKPVTADAVEAAL